MMRFWCLLFMALWTAMVFADPVTLKIVVDKVERTALVYTGKENPARPVPVLLAFHGFLSNAGQMDLLAHLEKEWPEAIVVYPQGLPVHLALLHATGAGWQSVRSKSPPPLL